MNDSKLNRRVIEFVRNSDVPLNRIRAGYIADELKKKYFRDYARKPKVPFQIAVTRIFNEYIKKANLERYTADEDSISETVNHIESELTKKPHSFSNLNDLLTDSFKKSDQPPINSNNGVGDDEIIDDSGRAIGLISRTTTLVENHLNCSTPKLLKGNDATPVKMIDNLNNDKDDEKQKKRKISKSMKSEAKFACYEILKPKEKFGNLVGMNDIIDKLKVTLFPFKLKEWDLCPRGILISGPIGCGKNKLARCMAAELDLSLVLASGRQLMAGGVASEKSENVQKLFDQAIASQPCFILIEDIDLIDCTNETVTSNADKPVLNSLLINIDRLKRSKHNVWLIGLAGKRENVNPDLLRDNRFIYDYRVNLPDASNRTQLLKIFAKKKENCSAECDGSAEIFTTNNGCKRVYNFNLSDEDFKTLSFKTPSYSPSDLRELVREAIVQSLYRQKDDLNPSFSVDLNDFEEALCIMKPTTMVEDTISIPEVTWKDIGALQTIRKELVSLILIRIKNPVLMAKCGLSKPTGVMLFGPPGCGKTLVAKALANEASINFLSVKGPELIDKYVGESERNIRSLFQRAKECSPCLIFFDEIDSISERRSSHAHGGGTKVVQQLLTVLDGVENRDGVFVMGATNRLDCVDPAFLRSNRFGKVLYVGLPSAEGRLEILQSITKNGTIPKMASDVNLEFVASDDRCNGLSGADLSELVNMAATSALNLNSNYSTTLPGSQTIRERCLEVKLFDKVDEVIVTLNDFENALSQIRPSVSLSDLASYENMARQYS